MSHFTIERAIRPNILALQPYRCARDDYQKGILLDANENALGHSIATSPDEELDGELLNADLHRYPDPLHPALKTKIAQLRSIPSPEHIFLGVGSDEAIDLLMRITCTPGAQGDAILITPPTYGMYAVCAQVNDVKVLRANLNADFSLDVPKVKDTLRAHPETKLVFLCSPGNPTGTCISLDAMREILSFDGFKGLVVVDEAYIDFAPPGSSAAGLVQDFPNLVVMQTLSKSFGLAAIRLGIAIAQPALIQILLNTKAPYNISTPTSILAMRALSPESTKLRQEKISTLIASRSTLVSDLAAIAHLGLGDPIGSGHANFVIIPVLNITTKEPDSKRAHSIYKALAEEMGVVVRYRGNEVGCLGCLRITIGSKEENQTLLKCMKDALTKF